MSIPEGMTAEKLRAVADWLDIYDRMGESYLYHIEHSGWSSTEDLAEVRLTISSKEVQEDLLRWADEIESDTG